MSTKAIERAIQIAGNQSKLARAINVKQQNVWWWLHKTKKVPAEIAVKVEAATKGQVTRHDLRPDLFERPPTRDAA